MADTDVDGVAVAGGGERWLWGEFLSLPSETGLEEALGDGSGCCCLAFCTSRLVSCAGLLLRSAGGGAVEVQMRGQGTRMTHAGVTAV